MVCDTTRLSLAQGRLGVCSRPACQRTRAAWCSFWKLDRITRISSISPDGLKLGNNVWLSAYGPHNWGYVATVTPQQTNLTIPRGKAAGGSSAVNGQVLYRGISEDYDNWASWGNDEWSFRKILPYFRKMETDMDFSGDFHGSDGPVPVRRYKREEWLPHSVAFHQACVAADFRDDPDQNHPESTGVSPRARNTLNGVRISIALAYLDPACHRLNE